MSIIITLLSLLSLNVIGKIRCNFIRHLCNGESVAKLFLMYGVENYGNFDIVPDFINVYNEKTWQKVFGVLKEEQEYETWQNNVKLLGIYNL